MRERIQTAGAPNAIGTYSQAIATSGAVYLSGQIGLDPATGELVDGFEKQAHRVFTNLRAVAQAAGGKLDDAVRLTVFLVDFGHFAQLNEIMAQYFQAPYPSRSTVQVAALPKGALIEVDAILTKS